MEIKKTVNGTALTVQVKGRLDTRTAVDLEAEINGSISGVDELIYDFAELEYISSAGLRVLLASHKTMMKKGTMVIRNCSDEIMEIFDVTGFTDILNIEG